MTDPKPIRTAEEETLEIDLINEIISMYHTTRLNETPAAFHIRSKSSVQKLLARHRALRPAPASDVGREDIARDSDPILVLALRRGELWAIEEACRILALRPAPASDVERVLAAIHPAWFASDYNHRECIKAVRKALTAAPSVQVDD